jgi:excisionase family DNA binding protein
MARLLSVKEAAEVLRLGHTKFYALLKRGELRPVRMTRSGRRMMGIRRSDLEAYTASKQGKIRSVTRSATRLKISNYLHIDCNQLQSMRNEELLLPV